MLSALKSAVPILKAAWEGGKALATLKMPPPGTKTVTANLVIILGWAAATLGLDAPPEVINAAATVILFLANLVLRKLTKGPLPGED